MLSTIIPALEPGDWFSALDLQDAYFHIIIYPDHRWFLRFTLGTDHYQYKVLPYGLSSTAGTSSLFQNSPSICSTPKKTRDNNIPLFG